MSHFEKKGPIPHPDSLIRGFNDVLHDYELSDLGMVGYDYTWERGKGTYHWVEECLDRAVTSTDWCRLFMEATVRNCLTFTSDHSAIFLNLEVLSVRKRGKQFKFEAAWLYDENCAKIVELSLRRSYGSTFQQRISSCGYGLWRWGGDYFKNFGNEFCS